MLSYFQKLKKNRLSDKLCVTIITASTMIPFIVCDMYYGLNDITCINQKNIDFNLTMYDYLIVNSICGIILFTIINCVVYFINGNDDNIDNKYNNNNLLLYIYNVILVISLIIIQSLVLFNIIWLIVGFMILWKYMNTHSCSLTVFNYLSYSLIIKLIINVCHIYSFLITKN
jgi:hypothetical protein